MCEVSAAHARGVKTRMEFHRRRDLCRLAATVDGTPNATCGETQMQQGMNRLWWVSLSVIWALGCGSGEEEVVGLAGGVDVGIADVATATDGGGGTDLGSPDLVGLELVAPDLPPSQDLGPGDVPVAPDAADIAQQADIEAETAPGEDLGQAPDQAEPDLVAPDVVPDLVEPDDIASEDFLGEDLLGEDEPASPDLIAPDATEPDLAAPDTTPDAGGESWPTLCDPCVESSACEAPAGLVAACVSASEPLGAFGYFCATACVTSTDCPGGYTCAGGTSLEGAAGSWCQPSSGACGCSAEAAANGLSTSCFNGACQGKRTCLSGGLSSCDAALPSIELCDGKDNDCNAKTDEAPESGALCDDGNPCTTDFCKGSEGCGAIENAEPCDDGDACTTGDACAKGACGGSPLVCDDNNACTDDACDSKIGCASTPKSGGACDDGSACTSGDACANGACAGTPVMCDDANVCTDDACDPAKGCAYTPNAASCDDGSACTKGDVCTGGTCAGEPITCDDGNACTGDSCDKASGCAFAPNAASCDDGNACTTGDACAASACAGAALSCDDGNPCTDDGCDPKSGCTHAANVSSCDDGNACTTGDACAGGVCAGKAVDSAVFCDDTNACTTDVCNPTSGCASTPNTNACDDGNACTVGDTCGAGACASGQNTCDCQQDGDCEPAEDGDLCNGTLFCDVSKLPFKCKVDPKSIVTCKADKDSFCIVNTCDPKSGGCALVPRNEAQPCDADASVCTVGDTCAAGVCAPGPLDGCDDQNPCTDDGCDPKQGCQHKSNTASCSDGNACTVGDHCDSGSCVVSTLACNDGYACTSDGCDPTSGCTYTPVADPGCGLVPLPFAESFPCGADSLQLWQRGDVAQGGTLVRWDFDATPAKPGYSSPKCSLNANDGTGLTCGNGQSAIAASAESPWFDATSLGGGAGPVKLRFKSAGSWSVAAKATVQMRISGGDFVQIAAFNPTADWTLVELSQPGWKGKKFQVRFLFASSACNGAGTGWFIDDVQVFEDKCQVGNGGCATNATCAIGETGAPVCTCKAGYLPLGNLCIDIDECANSLHDCAKEALCTNAPGTYGCACNKGWAGDGKTCFDIDECAQGLDKCSPFATCTNTLGAYTCACNSDYYGDGITCVGKGQSQDYPAPSCGAILAAFPQATDGTYWLDFDDAGPSPVGQYACDMGNGGWTRLYLDDFQDGKDHGWSPGAVTQCGSFGSIWGGYGLFGAGASTQKSVSVLPAHTQLKLALDFRRIDSWDGESGWLQLDGATVWTKSGVYYNGTQLCGAAPGNWVEENWPVAYQGAHSATSVTVRAGSTLDQNAYDESWAIDNAQVWVK